MTEPPSLGIAGDEHNTVEHILRDHVNSARQMWDVETQDADCRVPNLYIVYRADDGGKWQLQSFAPDIVTRGAELMLVVQVHIHAYKAHANIAVLRSAITHEPHNDV